MRSTPCSRELARAVLREQARGYTVFMFDPSLSDPFDLQRFLDAQEHTYDDALAEIRSGLKRGHWMWFIFPQIDGLGYSSMSKRYAVQNADEAGAYLSHPILGPRLIEITEALLAVKGRTVRQIFGTPDDMKLKSCATLFAAVSPASSVFESVLERFYSGERDERTLQLLNLK
jgi:uncharacterized protein (DUF1810 family)